MIGLDLVFILAFVRIHTTPTIQRGYAGTDQTLDDSEVDKFISHVLAECSLICLFTICLLEPMLFKHLNYKYDDTTKLIFGATFCGSVAYAIAKHTVKARIKTTPPPADNPPQT